jgi:hypothetical protein
LQRSIRRGRNHDAVDYPLHSGEKVHDQAHKVLACRTRQLLLTDSDANRTAREWKPATGNERS